MKMMIALLLFATVVGCALGQTPPNISETYRADLTIHIQNGTNWFFGRGAEIRDQPAGKAVVQYIFHDNHSVENVYVLERYDLQEQYSITRNEKCLMTKLANQTMPLQWAWLRQPGTKNVGSQVIDGKNASIWELKIGYAEVAVAVDAAGIPLVYWRRTPTRNLTVIFENFDNKAPINPKAGYFDVPNECKNKSAPARHQRSMCLAGATAIASAKVWADQHVPYSQTSTHDGYRTDCSGYVSMAWELAKPGLTTFTLPSVSSPISKAELKAGDVLLDVQEHVVLFAGWTSSAQTQYYAYEETRPGEGTVGPRATPYPYWYNTASFKPYRYKNLC